MTDEEIRQGIVAALNRRAENGGRHLHPFLPTDAAADNPTCEVCGLGEPAPVHADRDTVPDPFTAPADEGDS